MMFCQAHVTHACIECVMNDYYGWQPEDEYDLGGES